MQRIILEVKPYPITLERFKLKNNLNMKKLKKNILDIYNEGHEPINRKYQTNYVSSHTYSGQYDYNNHNAKK